MIGWFRRKPEGEQVETGGAPQPEPTAAPDSEQGEPGAPAPEQASGAGFFGHMRERLEKTRKLLVGGIDRLVHGKKEITSEVLDDLEEVLIGADLGVATTQKLIKAMEEKLRRQELTDSERLRVCLKEEMRRLLKVEAPALEVGAHKPFVIMAIGVNGVGKTTTLAKIAHLYQETGLRVMLVAGDTFRAAAVAQLATWAERVGAELVKQKTGADPAAVVYDAVAAAQAREVDVVLIDTAGRLHTKVNLMEEIKKVRRVIDRQLPGAPHEILLILDATTGQNALSQTRLFHQELGVTGLVLTKLDGTAKGGIVVGICQEFQIPIRFIGLGEGLDDLKEFDADQFAEALF
ncbi:MAG TPA: signal recognition particle-docking protein FtsY [Syntrophobacteria bacterium]|nr:signal recognition particle-docking protein FtsY [Syntrophobacteria bacterium]